MDIFAPRDADTAAPVVDGPLPDLYEAAPLEVVEEPLEDRPEEVVAEEAAYEAAYEAGETAEQRVGFFSRLFGRKADANVTDDASEESVEDAPAGEVELAEPAELANEITPTEPEPVDLDRTLDPAEPVGSAPPDFDRTLDPAEVAVADPPWWEVPAEVNAVTGADASTRPTDEVEAIDDESARTTDAVPVVDDARTTDELQAIPDTDEAAPRRSLMARLLGWRRRGSGPAGATSGEATRASQSTFIVSKFRAFYGEILRYKHQQSEFAGAFQTMIADTTAASEDPDSAAQQLSFRLQQVLELQSAEATWTGGESAARYPHAQYAMAALADETFRTMEWPGRVAWDKYALELKLFQTRSAPSEFFKRVNRLLREENPSVEARDLARVYLMVLASGFRGLYTDPRLDRLLADYRRRLYEFIHGGDALMLYAADRVLSPNALERTVGGKGVSRFSGAQRWAAVLILLIGGYVFLAHTAWTRLSADLRDVTSRIESVTRATSGASSTGGAP